MADLSGTNPERLSGISDGIFSVGMTLLVLGLVVPTLNGVATTEGAVALCRRDSAVRDISDLGKHRLDHSDPAQLRFGASDPDTWPLLTPMRSISLCDTNG